MTHPPTPDHDRQDDTARNDILDILSEAGLGQGHGLSWWLDRLAPGEDRT